MISNVPHSWMFPGALAPRPDSHATLYLLAATLCLLVALRYLRQAIRPIGALVHAAAAAAVVAFATGVAVVLLIAALVGPH